VPNFVVRGSRAAAEGPLSVSPMRPTAVRSNGALRRFPTRVFRPGTRCGGQFGSKTASLSCSPNSKIFPIKCILAVFILAGCAAPVSVQRLTLSESYRQLDRSALSGDALSDSTLIVLRRHNLLKTWDKDPSSAIAALRVAVVGQPGSWPELFALAELSYYRGLKGGAAEDFLAAAIYAYAYLAPGEDEANRPSPYDQRFVQACDIYNLGLTAAFASPNGAPIQIATGSRALPFGSISLAVAQRQLEWNKRRLVNFQPTAPLAVSGLQNIYRSPGLGEAMAALAQPNAVASSSFQVAPKLRIPTNLVLVVDDPRSQITQSSLSGRLVVHTIYDGLDMQIGQETVPLEFDQTAARALGLVENAGWSNEYTGFLNGTLFERSKPQLVGLEPHQFGRMPVILIHGTASSAFRWADMVNDLLEDPEIRDHFEFWFFTYATGNPIPYSALQLRRAIEGSVAQLGGVQADPALGRITLIGHSQGGLLAKMVVIDPGDRLWDGMVRRPLSSLKLSDKSRRLLQETLFPKPVPEVQRVIFIATPQHGSYVAAMSLSQLVGRLVTLPLSVTEAGREVLSGNGGNVILGQGTLRFGSVYGMSPNSPLIKSLAAIPIAPGVHAHSIIPVSTSGPVAQGNDGVVRYASAHIDGVDSELVVHSGHSTQSNPSTIGEVRRILLLQLGTSGAAAATP
jgi:pimeloyl-ACP methyl ester carboxylesterase